MGTHQKIDRVSHRNLLTLIPDKKKFPKIKDILHFEGNNGPDGMKRKSPANDEPWHFYDPFDEDDSQLLDILQNHYDELVLQLKKGSPERAAFDAAWLAHAVVDGLTPAHHFPYEEKLTEIRGEGMETRDSILNKNFVYGDKTSETLKKNWAIWGAGGLWSMHALFEGGVALIWAPIKIKHSKPTDTDIETMLDLGFIEYYKRVARQVAMLDLYDRFYEKGWTPKLVRDVRNELAPAIFKAVCLVWYSAMRDAGQLRGKK